MKRGVFVALLSLCTLLVMVSVAVAAAEYPSFLPNTGAKHAENTWEGDSHTKLFSTLMGNGKVLIEMDDYDGGYARGFFVDQNADAIPHDFGGVDYCYFYLDLNNSELYGCTCGYCNTWTDLGYY